MHLYGVEDVTHNVQDAGIWDYCSNAHTTKVYILWLNTILPCAPTLLGPCPTFCVFIKHTKRTKTDIGASWDMVGSPGDKLQCDMDCGNQKVNLVSSSAVTRCWTYFSCYLSQCVHNNNNLSYLSFIVVY